MKINQIPDIYIEQYLLGELPENLRNQMDELIAQNTELSDRINIIRESNEEILTSYSAESMVRQIMAKTTSADEAHREKIKKEKSPGIINGFPVSLKNIIEKISSVSGRRYTLSIASAAAIILLVIFMIPGIRNIDNVKTPGEYDVRIKGLDSKLLLYRMKGKEVEELKNANTARSGDIIQVGYIAAGNFRHGVILSIDGRGAVTLHLPEVNTSNEKLILNKRVLLKKSYELDDSPSFERFIMILSADPIDTADVMEKAKKLANSRENAVNGLIETGKDSIELSITLKKIE